jgi:hypothetical protein
LQVLVFYELHFDDLLYLGPVSGGVIKKTARATRPKKEFFYQDSRKTISVNNITMSIKIA